MVELFLQEYKAGIATYECTPEGRSDEKFTMSIHLERGEIVKLSLPKRGHL